MAALGPPDSGSAAADGGAVGAGRRTSSSGPVGARSIQHAAFSHPASCCHPERSEAPAFCSSNPVNMLRTTSFGSSIGPLLIRHLAPLRAAGGALPHISRHWKRETAYIEGRKRKSFVR